MYIIQKNDLLSVPVYLFLFVADGDYERIWLEHCEDEASLDEYAFAMQHLATEHWSAKHPDDRIKWCHHACRDYFFRGGKDVLHADHF